MNDLPFEVEEEEGMIISMFPPTYQYAFFCVVLMLLTTTVFLSLLSLDKMLIVGLVSVVCLILLWTPTLPTVNKRNFFLWTMSFSVTVVNSAQMANFTESFRLYCRSQSVFLDLRQLATIVLCLVMFILLMQSRHSELVSRLNFIWKMQAMEERLDTEKLQTHSRKLLENILPVDVADYFLRTERGTGDLYYEWRGAVCVLFATITNFGEFYTELDANNEGVECLRLLNEIIADFDEILSRPEYAAIEKIKTISTTYMAACGLTGQQNEQLNAVTMANFAMDMLRQLRDINEHSFNNFTMRIGLNIGPVVAGVIGAKKPHYDIWSNSVNVASRMDSSGVPGKIQVTEELERILSQNGFQLECRGVIDIKGKGEMTTYFLKNSQL